MGIGNTCSASALACLLLNDLLPFRKNGEAIEGMFVCVLALVTHAEDPLRISIQDRHTNGEERWQTIGRVKGVQHCSSL